MLIRKIQIILPYFYRSERQKLMMAGKCCPNTQTFKVTKSKSHAPVAAALAATPAPAAAAAAATCCAAENYEVFFLKRAHKCTAFGKRRGFSDGHCVNESK